MITYDELRGIMPFAGKNKLNEYLEPLNQAMKEFGISDNVQREAAFIAQIAHESGSLNYVKELASGEAYEGRADLGNTEAGDGVKYKGRGLIQITGKTNYSRVQDSLGIECVENAALLEIPINGARSAGWFWQTHGLNELADKGDFLTITKRINGGTNGYQDRLAFWERAKKVLG